MQNLEKSLIRLDGLSYASDDLPQIARDTLVSLQFVEARLRELHGELAVSQTAHVTCARALKAELNQTVSTLVK